MTLEEFQKQVLGTGSYETPAPRRFVYPPWLATPAFKIRMSSIFLRSYFEAFSPDYYNRYWALLGFRVMRATEGLGGRVSIEGFENLHDCPDPVVFVSNHVSSLETYLFEPILLGRGGIAYVLKESLNHYPIFGRTVRATRPISVSRKNPLEDLKAVLRQGTEALREGRSVVIFPQGTRHRQFDPAEFRTLGTKLAQHAKVRVVPLCVATDFIRIGLKNRDLGAVCHPESTIRIACGAPLSYDLPPAELQARQIEFIESTLRRWEALDKRPLLLQAPASDGSQA